MYIGVEIFVELTDIKKSYQQNILNFTKTRHLEFQSLYADELYVYKVIQINRLFHCNQEIFDSL